MRYTYDPIGNIVRIEDAAQQDIYFRNARVEPSARYGYDALSRLVRATGREHLGQGGRTRPDGPVDARAALHPADGDAMGRYAERYDYDIAGT